MRFKLKSQPKDGDHKVVVRFAWFPVIAVDQRTNEPFKVWLDLYAVEKVWCEISNQWIESRNLVLYSKEGL